MGLTTVVVPALAVPLVHDSSRCDLVVSLGGVRRSVMSQDAFFSPDAVGMPSGPGWRLAFPYWTTPSAS